MKGRYSLLCYFLGTARAHADAVNCKTAAAAPHYTPLHPSGGHVSGITELAAAASGATLCLTWLLLRPRFVSTLREVALGKSAVKKRPGMVVAMQSSLRKNNNVKACFAVGKLAESGE